ncbi:MAG: undecaprenyl-diphosphate phosphatase [Candidatus Paceibacterota bacterium]
MGLFQSPPLVPGVSRSGATIVGGMLLTVSKRAEAARFAFLYDPGYVGGAGAKKLLELLTHPESIPVVAVMAGAVVFLLGWERFIYAWFCPAGIRCGHLFGIGLF